MELFVVLDLSQTLGLKIQPETTEKVENAIRFAETLIQQVDHNDVTVSLFFLAQKPTLAKAKITDHADVRKLFRTFISELTAPIGPTEYGEVKNLLSESRQAPFTEVVILTDIVDAIPFPEDLCFACSMRFVILSNYEVENVSEAMVAVLERASIHCSVLAGLIKDAADALPEDHMPMFLCEQAGAVEGATSMGVKFQTEREGYITLGVRESIKINFSPGLPRHILIFNGEVNEHEIVSPQEPTFQLVGFTATANTTRVPLSHQIYGISVPEKSSGDILFCLTQSLLSSGAVGILQHSSGEEWFLRAHGGPTMKLFIQPYAKQYAQWKRPSPPVPPTPGTYIPSYKNQDHYYWNDTVDVQQDINKLCRRLKRDTTARQFYEDLLRISQFACACNLKRLSIPFGNWLERRGAAQELSTNPHLNEVVGRLRSENGFEVLQKILPAIIASLPLSPSSKRPATTPVNK